MPDRQIEAYIGLGSNLGDRRALIDAAVERLRNTPGVRVTAVSGMHDTEPVGGPAGQRRYLNAAARLDTTLRPRDLLERLLAIEAELGRERRERWGPRTIDLDLLMYGDATIDEPGLTVPHPRMHERSFVLNPLAEIAPDARHPRLGKTVTMLCEERSRRP